MEKEIVISNVQSGSIAEEVGISVGDILVSINEVEIKDIIEYRYIVCEEFLTVIIRKPDGEEWEIEIEKDYYEDIGIDFEDPIIDHAKRCHNKCIFCFIDQLPKNLRETLYFKDDDSRLSFLQGNFVTLTNMKDEDIERIIKYRISPINISVHTTNPDLRRIMLNNKDAGLIMERLKRLSENGIDMNCQIVLCPGINDGEELNKTVKDLFSLYPNVSNVAIVPVGVTRYREGLHKMQTFTNETSINVIDMIEKLQKEIVKEVGEPFVRLADEFYVMANRSLPSISHYGDFHQIEDGIGMIRYLESCVDEDLINSDVNGNNIEIGFVTGESAYSYIRSVADKIESKLNLKINVHMIKNNFFGGEITVAGLIVGSDIIAHFKDKKVEDFLILPSNMLKADEDIFLDDTTLDELKDKLGVKIIKCKYTGEDLVGKIIDEVITCQNQ
ncbi:DUF512 domain-containing protein [Clostridium cylindrosporum]|uniref:Fe-S oxidoreductase, NifB/MoaA family n=1 Tax=Clostridium cylindrosporum DSM 605 TaxID=1121307 RepID=A0A0J8D5L4_CLOCY|nr:DUF512 domain-containing protein [Clostridium cylindrosporum]KMT21425.1 Fe-S oxidoreductase, NifB/MoaA family [Clostridium cylindrosporum DSM 605]